MVGQLTQAIRPLQFLKRQVTGYARSQMPHVPLISDEEDKVVTQLTQTASVLALALIDRGNQFRHFIDNVAYAERLMVDNRKAGLSIANVIGNVERAGRERNRLK